MFTRAELRIGYDLLMRYECEDLVAGIKIPESWHKKEKVDRLTSFDLLSFPVSTLKIDGVCPLTEHRMKGHCIDMIDTIIEALSSMTQETDTSMAQWNLFTETESICDPKTSDSASRYIYQLILYSKKE